MMVGGMEGNKKREALRSECQVGVASRKSFLLICTSFFQSLLVMNTPSKSQLKRLERESTDLRKRIFNLRVQASEFEANLHADIDQEQMLLEKKQQEKKQSIILELQGVLNQKNTQLKELVLGHSL